MMDRFVCLSVCPEQGSNDESSGKTVKKGEEERLWSLVFALFARFFGWRGFGLLYLRY